MLFNFYSAFPKKNHLTVQSFVTLLSMSSAYQLYLFVRLGDRNR